MTIYLIDLIYFVWKQALCCLFPISIFITLWLSTVVVLNNGQSRYDFIFIILVLLQIFFVAVKYEKLEELRPIIFFHLLGLLLEIFKVGAGRWSYPEQATFMLLGVPLYSGFMYASVASYVLQANRRLKLKYYSWPNIKVQLLLATAIYINFFTNLIIPDLRVFLLLSILLIFIKVKVEFTPRIKSYTMPILVSFLLISIFIWIAENISTFFKAWVYPHQSEVWKVVDLNIISSWFLLVILIIILINSVRLSKNVA